MVHFTVVGTPVLKEVHRGCGDGRHGRRRAGEGWRGQAEGEEEGEEAARSHELQVTCWERRSRRGEGGTAGFASNRPRNAGRYALRARHQNNTDEPNLLPLSVIAEGSWRSIGGPRRHLLRAFLIIGCQSAAKTAAFLHVQ